MKVTIDLTTADWEIFKDNVWRPTSLRQPEFIGLASIVSDQIQEQLYKKCTACSQYKGIKSE